MAQLVVRNLDNAIVQALKMRAAQHGCSAESEHRAILRAVLLPDRNKTSFKEHLMQIPPVGNDEDFVRDSDQGRDIDLFD